jgi:hypothetical protein
MQECAIDWNYTDINNSYFSFKTERVKVLYGCETWSLTLRKEKGLKVFEKTA